MQPLPTGDLRTNIASWAVSTCQLPAVAYWLPHLAPPESFDPTFRGQELRTIYLDTQKLLLRKARRQGNRYLTLRVRCYANQLYAVSAKTEDQKWRLEIPSEEALGILSSPRLLAGLLDSVLPPDLRVRLDELIGEEPLQQAVTISCRRYAVESPADRYTLDVEVATDTGKCLSFAVLEYKSTDAEAVPSGQLTALPLRPLKLSKFLWASGV